MKNVLILGGGGREHAIAEKLRKSDKVGKIFCLPGNAGISEIAECKDISPMDFDAVYDFIEGCDFKATPVDMVVVASDDPLAKGMVDFLTEKGIRAFGPTKKAAELEWSKSYAKDFMYRHGIPTAKSASFDTYKEALAYVERQEYPCVIKADGLALGKGVIICNDFDEAKKALSDIMLDKYFGESGSRVVVEEFMKGKEVSVLALTDGKTIVPMVSAQDHKKIYDGDEGPNTGGMGAFSPSAAYTDEVRADFEKNVMYPTLRGLIEDGIEYKGVIYFGLMITDSGVKVVEYNSRFGDPETQVVLPRLDGDLYEIFDAVIDGRLADVPVKWYDNCAVCVIIASNGYPYAYDKGFDITIDNPKNVTLYHAGTRYFGDRLVTNGGRVMGVTATADTIDEARRIAYVGVARVHFKGEYFRTDIGLNL